MLIVSPGYLVLRTYPSGHHSKVLVWVLTRSSSRAIRALSSHTSVVWLVSLCLIVLSNALAMPCRVSGLRYVPLSRILAADWGEMGLSATVCRDGTGIGDGERDEGM